MLEQMGISELNHTREGLAAPQPERASSAVNVSDQSGTAEFAVPELSRDTGLYREFARQRIQISQQLLDDNLRWLYRCLFEILGQQYYLAMRVPLVDMLLADTPVTNSRFKGHRASCIVCNRHTSEPLVVIQMDDAIKVESATSASIMELIKDAEIPFIRLGRDEDLSLVILKKKLAAYIDVEAGQKACPKCGQSMSLKLVTKGNSAGKTFWVCRDYPQCRGVSRFGNL